MIKPPQKSKPSRRDARTTKAFGEVLRMYRIKAGLTQEKLAAECSMDRAYVSEIERGLKEPCLSTLLKLGQVLLISSGDLLRDTEQRLVE